MSVQLKNLQTVRVFFSSPFKGMEEEREELTRKYFPQIQHKCAEMGLQFVAVDMRWGITTEAAENAQTVNICLREIDRSDMFVCFFGQRYGWHQAGGHSDGLLEHNIESALAKYPWLNDYRDRSVTELELLHGHLNNPGAMPACVLFRDQQYDDAVRQMRKDKAVHYTTESAEAHEKLDNLKKRVKETKAQALAVHFDYPNPLEGAKLMFEEVMKFLENKVVNQSAEMSKREKELAPHKGFMGSRTSLYVGKPEDFDRLDGKLKHKKVKKEESPDKEELPSKEESPKNEGSPESKESPHMLVLGPAGSGKSALICNWIQDRVSKSPDVFTIPYFIGCAPSTRNPNELLNFIYTELEHYLGDINKGENTERDQQTRNGARDKKETSRDSENGGQQSGKESATAGNDKGDDGAEITVKETDNSKADIEEEQPDSSVDGSGKLDTPGGAADSQSPGEGSSKQGENSGKDDTTKTSDTKSSGDSTTKNSEKSKSDADGSRAKDPERPKGKELQRAIIRQLERAVEKGQTVLLVFDAVNRLVAQSKTSKPLYWLPKKLPDGVVCVVATDETDQVTLDILVTQCNYDMLRLLPLDDDVQREICVQTLKHSGKELLESQLNVIIEARQTSNPLFLKTVLAELSIFGSFRQLDSKIKSLISVANIKELLHNCLARLEADYNVKEYVGNLVGEILAALEVSWQGLTETEIMRIFNIQSHVWSPLYFAIEYFTVSNRGMLGFSTSEVKDAVRERYLHSPEEERRIREKLIRYFDGVRKSLTPWTPVKQLCEAQNVHAMLELVWLQKEQGDRRGLIISLSDVSLFIIMEQDHDLDLLELWNWTETRWRDATTLLLNSFDRAITDCYLLTQEGMLGDDKSPGVRLRLFLAHMRTFFDLVMHFPAVEKALEREIRILENAEGKMDEEKRKEYLRDALYYHACNYASMDMTKESKAAHEANLKAFQEMLEEMPDDIQLQKQIAYTNNGLGLNYMALQNYDKAIEHLLVSGAYHEKSGDKKNAGATYVNLGLVYMYKENFTTALMYNEKAIEAYEECFFGQMPVDVGNLYTNMGLCYRRMRNLGKAEEMYLKSLETKANAVGWDHPVIATANMNLGTLEMHRRNYAKAEEWTRKAIAIYEVNEYKKTKEEYRRCRENLFANMLKQNKMEELMPLYIEIFDILKANGWLDECLAGMHRQVVAYMMENGMRKKAEEVSMALIDSPKVHPQNYLQLFTMDMDLPKDQRPVRPYQYTLEAALDKYPSHSMHKDLCVAKMKKQLLPEEGREGIRKLILHVAELNNDSYSLDLITSFVEKADELGKTELLYEVLKGMVEEDTSNKKLCMMFLRLCVHMKQAADAVPYLETIRTNLAQDSNQGLMILTPEQINPERSRLDIGLLLVAQSQVSEARHFFTEVIRLNPSGEIKKEAQAALDELPKDSTLEKGDGGKDDENAKDTKDNDKSSAEDVAKTKKEKDDSKYQKGDTKGEKAADADVESKGTEMGKGDSSKEEDVNGKKNGPLGETDVKKEDTDRRADNEKGEENDAANDSNRNSINDTDKYSNRADIIST